MFATIDFSQSITQREEWSKYFDELATPIGHSHYDSEYKNVRELQHLLNQQESGHNPELSIHIDDEATKKHLSKMKNGKSS